MSQAMFLAGARALAGLADASDPTKGLLPDISRLREVSATVAVDVVKTAQAAGLARVEVGDPIEAVHKAMWEPEYPQISLT
jgi:malate dehydrogenase (oxaloacetate-decarboxylating)